MFEGDAPLLSRCPQIGGRVGRSVALSSAMAPDTPTHRRRAAWAVAAMHHDVISGAELAACGYTPDAIRHERRSGRLHQLHPGVYAVGRRSVSREGRWMAAVLGCGAGAVLSHLSAGLHWGLLGRTDDVTHVTLPRGRRARAGIECHWTTRMHATVHEQLPVTTPARTIIDLAALLGPSVVEPAVNAADRLGLVDPEQLRGELDASLRGLNGSAVVRRRLDRTAFTPTDSVLERRFLRIARRAGLPPPQTQCLVNGYRVDAYWPDLGLVVETDGLRYHRTPAQQAVDRRRDQAHIAAGLAPLRFTWAQVRYEPAYVEGVLRRTATRLRARSVAGAGA
jgi:very-short-patch-repair endonuclease/predicted transcriptional regulator of viral defense system